MAKTLEASIDVSEEPRTALASFWKIATRFSGVLLLVLTVVPIYRLLDRPETGLAGAVVTKLVEVYYEFAWYGALLVLIPAVAGAVLLPGDRIEKWLEAGREWLIGRSQPGFALTLGALTAIFSACFAIFILEGVPNVIDSIAQMLHARFWAEGRLAGPVTDGGGFWAIQNALFTPKGWVSQYPPGHVAVLAVSVLLRMPWLGSALLAGVTVFMTALLADRVLGVTTEARLGAVLLAFSSFFVCIAGSFMNHVTAAAAVATGAYAWTRAWQGTSRWAYLAGAAFAYGVLTRPLSTIAAAIVLIPGIPLAVGATRTWTTWRSTLIRAVAGGTPFMAGLFAYNAWFFGHPLRLGYKVALGPAMGLGLHQDPWGNTYGFREALGYTSADLVSLSVSLFETPFPSLLIIGAFLVFGPELGKGARVIALWAMAAVGANFFYWHHGQLMGPRMLHESAPAWALLAALSIVGLYRRTANAVRSTRLDLRSGYVAAIACSFLIATVYLIPQRVVSYGGKWLDITRVPLPQVSGPALVFVHDGWIGRIAMQLASYGIRLDEIETAIRQNSTCTLQKYIDARDAGDSRTAEAVHAKLDLAPRAVNLPPGATISFGNSYRQWPGDALSSECLRQIRSDRNGVIDLAPLLARGDLPGGAQRGVLFVRDLGPEKNRRVLEEHPARTPYVYALPHDTAAPVLMPYDSGMKTFWGDAPKLADRNHGQ